MLLGTSCDHSPDHSDNDSAPTADSPLVGLHSTLANTLVALAASHDSGDESLALLVQSLTVNPSSTKARDQAEHLLTSTRWHLPEIRIQHPSPIDRIHFPAPGQLWVGLCGQNAQSGAYSTVARWNLETMQIESVLFPSQDSTTRSLVLDPALRRAVIERAGMLLLCDAQTLKPIREIGALPDFVNPSVAIVFSQDGLLFAHPAVESHSDPIARWLIRDSLAGEIIREISLDHPTPPAPLAAHLDSRSLRVIHQDGSLIRIPISPVETIEVTSPPQPVQLTHALITPNGNNTLVRQIHPPGDCDTKFLHPGNRGDFSLTNESLLHSFPWNGHIGIWSGLFHGRIEGRSRSTRYDSTHAPARTATDITAIALCGNRLVTGEERGFLTIHRILPKPLPTHSNQEPSPFDTSTLTALRHLSIALGGISYNPEFSSFTRHAAKERFQAFQNCDFTTLAKVFPGWDFSPIAREIESLQPLSLTPDALGILENRLARLSEQSTFPEIEEAFANADEEKIFTSIQNSSPSGAQAATCLHLALASARPAWISRCIESFTGLPPLLTRIAHTRVHWLENRKADAIAAWPDPFPDYDHIRRTEDWDGWESVDFRIAFEQVRQSVAEELSRLIVPANATKEQRDATYSHLTDESTLASIGRTRYARACLEAATRFASFPGETERTFELAKIARAMGAPPAPCLRAEALALTALQDHARARDRWIELITHQPVADHQPGDYAEAAYSSFENGDPTQAMAILATGMHRYPHDSAFALRAGWIALLTAHPDAAYRFLLAGHRTGWPADQAAYACALLTIASFQSGAPEESTVWHQQLLGIDTSWRDEKFITSLNWPDELKAVLRHLAEHAVVTQDR